VNGRRVSVMSSSGAFGRGEGRAALLNVPRKTRLVEARGMRSTNGLTINLEVCGKSGLDQALAVALATSRQHAQQEK